MHYCMPCVLPALNCPRVMSADAGRRTRTRGSHYLTNQKNSWPPAGRYPLLHPAPLPACPSVQPALYKPQVREAEVWGLQRDCTSGPLFTTAGLGTSRLPASLPMCKMCRALRPARGHLDTHPRHMGSCRGLQVRQAEGREEGKSEGEVVNVGERGEEVIKTESR